MTCVHENFDAFVDVHRLSAVDGGPIDSFSASLSVWCHDCAERFQFIGPLEVGDLPHVPTVSFDHTELRVPLRPMSAPPGFGLNRPGFRVTGTSDPDRSN